ncbi:MAG: hypothetical protein IT158_27425 [Bryobacterales bacterium]|nr:hypothetical protein [Bryobacterales bacterium]
MNPHTGTIHAAPRTLTLAEGTTLVVRTASTLSTRTSRSGEPFEATLERPLRLRSIRIGEETLSISTSKVGIGAGIGAAAGGGTGTAAVLATRGKPAVIPAESVLRFRLTAPVAIPGPTSAP